MSSAERADYALDSWGFGDNEPFLMIHYGAMANIANWQWEWQNYIFVVHFWKQWMCSWPPTFCRHHNTIYKLDHSLQVCAIVSVNLKLLSNYIWRANKTIGDEGITVDFWIIKIHTSNWSSNSWGSSNSLGSWNSWGSSNSWDHRIAGIIE